MFNVIDDVRGVWRKASTWGALALAGLAAHGLTSLGIAASVVSLAPPEIRAFIPLPVTGLLFAGWLGLRLWKQQHDPA